ncbi:hypothetical protein PtA15_7A760 [Puccinia triticina]|uniref:Cyclin N-terminal domain-containing protein n=1 Tax=Puccinia triticina TaxID=208348 RepID=A0ABY7CP53_9BASI|nr:uncharacterized protein PtA15_7A760 [Puccinia triticina]WAQ87031.1 hypothetical protein PtA15_7A760 [Puccinia triticina]
MDPPPPMNKIAEFAAQMICYLWFAEPRRTTTPITQAQLVPNPEFVVFIHNLLSTTQVSHSVVLLALFYIHRLKALNPIKPNAKSEYRIGVVSLMLANKMLDDHTYTAKTWSEVSRLPLSSLNDGEIEFLRGLHFELHVNIRDFSAWFKLLHGMVHLKDRHTAIALAAGPRTRWFKKMRVASAEGLSVLESLLSPIRNSTLMIQFPRWDGSPASVSSAYSAIVPSNALSMTPQQQIEFHERQIASLPPKTRTEYLSAQEQLEESMSRQKRISSIGTSISSSSRIPSSVHTPSSQQLLSQLAPMISLQDANGAYLGSAIVPATHPGGGQAGPPELCFRSITAGRRGTVGGGAADERHPGLINTSEEPETFPDDNRTGARGCFYSNFSNAGVPGVGTGSLRSADFFPAGQGAEGRFPPLAVSPLQRSSDLSQAQLVEPLRLQHLQPPLLPPPPPHPQQHHPRHRFPPSYAYT